ncbi:NAT_SF domain containing protein [uncultured Caudovirales phage]|uniref:NAT_SF domain containing protein n=1 Tax=uncultured Caudovirales phage TaxID=2100421 RepID=A0A6J5TAE2_9CAUD|nr:NAT_SF domain containing protein [uncultured Caudovirales phage]
MLHLTVRRVLPNEYPKYRTHLKALDPASKHMRFGYAVTDEIIDQLCDRWEADHNHNILFAIENANLDFIAVGHIAMYDEMELAFSVLKEHQGQGLGNLVMKRVIQWCRTNGNLKGCMVCLSSNAAIKHLCVKHGIHIHSEHGETLADIELDSPNITTYINEATDSNLAVADYIGKRFARGFKK